MKFPIVDPTKFLPKSSATDVMALSPLVMAMRMPQLMFEQAWPWYGSRKHEGEKAVYEKAAAMLESYGAVQAEIAQTMIEAWAGGMQGKAMDPTVIAKAWQNIAEAGLKPSAKRVRANYKRLTAK